MAEYDFYIDTKHTVWERAKYTVEAETEEEAQEKAVMIFNDATDTLVEPYEYESLLETLTPMRKEDNNGYATRELLWKTPQENKTILTN
jgi:hypothetical protein